MIAAEIGTAHIKIDVCPVTTATIFDSPDAADLISAYSSECLDPNAQPQRALYAELEKKGVLRCFAAYSGPDNLLIGFISVLSAVVPHDGHLISTIESVFVYSSYRHTEAWDRLLTAAEQYASEIGCHIISCGPRVGSRLDKVLTRRPGYKPTHTQHTKWLIEPLVTPELRQIEIEQAQGVEHE